MECCLESPPWGLWVLWSGPSCFLFLWSPPAPLLLHPASCNALPQLPTLPLGLPHFSVLLQLPLPHPPLELTQVWLPSPPLCPQTSHAVPGLLPLPSPSFSGLPLIHPLPHSVPAKGVPGSFSPGSAPMAASSSWEVLSHTLDSRVGGIFTEGPSQITLPETPPPAPCSSFLRAFSFPPETGLSPIISYLAKQQKGKGHIWVVPCHRSRAWCHSWPRAPVSESSSRECLPVALFLRAPGVGKKSFGDFK